MVNTDKNVNETIWRVHLLDVVSNHGHAVVHDGLEHGEQHEYDKEDQGQAIDLSPDGRYEHQLTHDILAQHIGEDGKHGVINRVVAVIVGREQNVTADDVGEEYNAEDYTEAK